VEEKDGIKTFYAKDQKAWRAWLKKNHSKEKSVWLILFKKKSSTPSVYYPEAVDEALCFGWIDSKPNKRDEESYFQFFAKRNSKSNWSKINKEKVAKLMKLGKMGKAGLEMVTLAKKTGTWDALNEVEEIVIPDDLQKAFSKSKIAATNFGAFPRSTKKGILDWILSAKRPETRQKRIDETVSLAKKNIRANQYIGNKKTSKI
jgi:uncharacterized protein YdeI (YjbR/CyaY-like superfamily)